MKIYISHDVDHLSVREHLLRDITIPKFLILTSMEFLKGLISLKTVLSRIGGLFTSKSWNNIDELIVFDKQHKVPATFFIATGSGKKGLVYTWTPTKKAIRKVKQAGLPVGVHGVEHQETATIQEEYKRMKEVLGHDEFGIRMHYLRINPALSKKLKELGYNFDASDYSRVRAESFYVKGMKTYPLNIMDTYLFSPLKQGLTLSQAKALTKQLLASFESQGAVHILLHQRHFNKKQFPRYYQWYVWLVRYCKEKKYKFATYS